MGARNFVNSNMFLKIFSAPDGPIGGVQVLIGHQKQRSPPLRFGLPWALKCSLTGRSTLVSLLPRPWTVWMRHGHGTMGSKCVNVPHIMRVDAPNFRSTHLTISTLVACQETNGIVKAGSHTYRFGGKYPDAVWVEKKKSSPRIYL